MSGHSKWAQIKRQKAVTDAARSKVFARFARLIALESKKVSGNVLSPSLKTTIDRAKAANMPKDGIDRAIARGISKDANTLERVVYEFYGPSGIAIVIDALTDNKNRTTQEIKHLLVSNGYEIAAQGSAVWAFKKEPDGTYTPNEQTTLTVIGDAEEKLNTLLTILDEHDDIQTVYTNARDYESTSD